MALAVVDTERYPIHRLHSPEGDALVQRCREQLKATGSVNLEGFIREECIEQMVAEVRDIKGTHHRLGLVSSYYKCMTVPDDADDMHPAKRQWAQDTHALAADLVAKETLIRQVYESPEVIAFLAAALSLPELHLFDDEFQCINLMYMKDGCSRAWHYDGSDFVVTMMMQQCDQGGEFEFAPFIRGEDGDENFDEVALLFNGQHPNARTSRVKAGTLNLFNGRRSMHRVRSVYGPTTRIIAVLSYDTKPGQKATREKNITLYGDRVRAIYEQRDAAAAAVKTANPDPDSPGI